MASVTIKEGSRRATIKLPFTIPDIRPIAIATKIIHGPPYGNRYAATIDEEESIVPMDRSIPPIKIGKVSPAATSKNTVDTVSIPVMFRMFAKDGCKPVNIAKSITTKKYGSDPTNRSDLINSLKRFLFRNKSPSSSTF
jgi:hypothetical protein